MTNEEAIERVKRVSRLYAYEQDYEAMDMAVEALKKQKPMKPVIGYAFPSKLREVMKRTDPEKAETKTDCCPVCGRTL